MNKLGGGGRCMILCFVPNCLPRVPVFICPTSHLLSTSYCRLEAFIHVCIHTFLTLLFCGGLSLVQGAQRRIHGP